MSGADREVLTGFRVGACTTAERALLEDVLDPKTVRVASNYEDPDHAHRAKLIEAVCAERMTAERREAVTRAMVLRLEATEAEAKAWEGVPSQPGFRGTFYRQCMAEARKRVGLPPLEGE